MDGKVGELRANGTHQHPGSLGFEQARHVLDGKEVNVTRHELSDEVDVVVQVVLGARGIRHVTGVADGGLDHAPGLVHRLDAELEVLDVVERVKHAEDVDAAVLRLLHKRLHRVVGVGGVAHRVGAAQEHLERHVGHLLAEGIQALPGALVQEAHGHVEGGPAPHLQREALVQRVRGVVRDTQHVRGAHARGQQGLVRVTPGGVRQQQALVRAHLLCKLFGAVLQQHLAPSAGLSALG
mmetsp:Transcript_25141/g.42062  ORF Transcript_25141/g.42062 Transcript_25141/m.42062 type:complete len:238 (-) Transcript_25141:1913-2626(-)